MLHRIIYLTCLIIGLFLTGCAIEQPPGVNVPEVVEEMIEQPRKNPRKNIEFNAVLRDPVIRRDFDHLKATARYAPITKVNGVPKFSPNTIKRLNEVSNKIVTRLNDHYHIDAKKHKTLISIARYKQNSCYQYYNSERPSSIGKNCSQLSEPGDSCNLCNSHVDAIKARNMKVISSISWLNEETTNLVSTFRLKNRDLVYVELQLSHP